MTNVRPQSLSERLDQHLSALDALEAEVIRAKPASCNGVRVWLDIMVVNLRHARAALLSARELQDTFGSDP